MIWYVDSEYFTMRDLEKSPTAPPKYAFPALSDAAELYIPVEEPVFKL